MHENTLRIPWLAAVPVPVSMCEEDYSWLLQHVSADRRQKAERMRRPQDAYRTLIGEALARTMIGCALDRSTGDIAFDHNDFGKPALTDHPHIHFNVSHSGQWVVCLLSCCPVGVDIEEIADIDMNVGKICFAREEYEDLLHLEVSDRISRFYELWTLKESYIKAVGRGLSIPLQSFHLKIEEDRSIRLHAEGEAYFFRQYEWDERYKLAACSREDHLPLSVDTMTIAQLREISKSI